MYNSDINRLKELLTKKAPFKGAKMKTFEGDKIFTSLYMLLAWLEHSTPLWGSFILLEDGGWVRWTGFTYETDTTSYWEHLELPTL
jgi:hypothetical protein